MTTPFDVDSSPITEPDALVIGTFAQWRRLFDYDGALFNLRYDVHDGGHGHDVTFTGTWDAANNWWVFTIGAADYGNAHAALYRWDLILERISDGEVVILETGVVRFFDTNSDRRTHAEIMVAKIESVLENRADHDIESYSIKDRSLTRMSPKELIQWRDFYIDEIKRLGGSVTSHDPKGNTVRVRFV